MPDGIILLTQTRLFTQNSSAFTPWWNTNVNVNSCLKYSQSNISYSDCSSLYSTHYRIPQCLVNITPQI